MLLSFILFFFLSMCLIIRCLFGELKPYTGKKKKKASIVLAFSTFNLTTLATFNFLF